MQVRVYESNYKDQKAVTIENEVLRAQFLPELGGKMASFFYKKTQKEFLVQAENKEYKILKYDGDYVEAECSGFDDMFPTIDACHYESFPWQGVKLPDHGEVCGIEWNYRIEKESLYMSAHGVRLPYTLEKHISFNNEHELHTSYKAKNLSNFDMDFLWAAHPMINAEVGGEIILPYTGEQNLTCVFSTDDNIGSYGDTMKWPSTKCKDLVEMPLNITSERNVDGRNYKYYYDEKIPEGWCAYKYKSDNTILVLSFPKEKVPYFCIWINEGSFHGFHSIAPEPCTGAYDRVDIAKVHKKNSILKAKGEYNWYLNFGIEHS